MEEELKISYIENKEIYTIDLEKIKEKCIKNIKFLWLDVLCHLFKCQYS